MTKLWTSDFISVIHSFQFYLYFQCTSYADINLILPLTITVSPEVDEKRPLQPNSVPNESNQETENDNKMPITDNKNTDAMTTTENNSMETNDQGIRHENDAPMEDESSINSDSLRRTSRRKQKIPGKVAHYPNPENDDDITDDETQTYSIDDNIRGPDYEDKFTKKLSMESSSPVF